YADSPPDPVIIREEKEQFLKVNIQYPSGIARNFKFQILHVYRKEILRNCKISLVVEDVV
nr:hypothetical protein [bacterium]